MQDLSACGSTNLCWNLAAFLFSWSFAQLDSLDGGLARRKAAKCTHGTAETQNKCTQTSMSQVRYEARIPAFQRAKTFHALYHAATVIGKCRNYYSICFSNVTPCSVIDRYQRYGEPWSSTSGVVRENTVRYIGTGGRELLLCIFYRNIFLRDAYICLQEILSHDYTRHDLLMFIMVTSIYNLKFSEQYFM
jgi:hypothetical protein